MFAESFREAFREDVNRQYDIPAAEGMEADDVDVVTVEDYPKIRECRWLRFGELRWLR